MNSAGNNDPVIIRVTGLTKRYGELIAVDYLNLDIYQGEIFGFLGPNGAGKSTSINMICGLIQPDGGQIFIHGQQAMHEHKLRNSFGLCPQEVIIWPKLTCVEQLIFMGEMYGMQAHEAKKSGLALLDRLELTTKAHKLGGILSGGMKRRLNLCLALVHNPDIVVLDEPEAGLDPQSRILVRDFIYGLRKSKTVVLTTHNMDEADRLSDRVAIIDNGRLLLTDTPENLKKTAGVEDILEITVQAGNGKDMHDAGSLARTLAGNVTVSGTNIVIREMNAIELIPSVTAKLKETGFTCTEIKMRTNTLEDVFIQLTGKRLRE
jgi:ABC-2 type transport system ATP-binding protein